MPRTGREGGARGVALKILNRFAEVQREGRQHDTLGMMMERAKSGKMRKFREMLISISKSNRYETQILYHRL